MKNRKELALIYLANARMYFDKIFDLLDREEECKEPILTDEEKVIVKDIINALKPFNFKFTHITKNGFSPEKKEYLSLIYDKDDKYIWVESPKFVRGEKFVGMELDKAYTLEELGL